MRIWSRKLTLFQARATNNSHVILGKYLPDDYLPES
jgi:hypothetical protein